MASTDVDVCSITRQTVILGHLTLFVLLQICVSRAGTSNVFWAGCRRYRDGLGVESWWRPLLESQPYTGHSYRKCHQHSYGMCSQDTPTIPIYGPKFPLALSCERQWDVLCTLLTVHLLSVLLIVSALYDLGTSHVTVTR
jgi:hypothetical protein